MLVKDIRRELINEMQKIVSKKNELVGIYCEKAMRNLKIECNVLAARDIIAQKDCRIEILEEFTNLVWKHLPSTYDDTDLQHVHLMDK